MQKYNFSYDSDSDDLFLYNPRSKSKGSVELGGLVLDYNSKKELVGIQIMNASNFIKDMVEESPGNIKDILSKLKECRVDIKARNNMIILKIFLASKIGQMSPIISIPSIRESSPALAYA